MGIVRLRGRDVVRLSTDAARACRRAAVDRAASGLALVRAHRRHRRRAPQPSRPDACPLGSVAGEDGRWPHDVSGGGVTRTTMAVTCIRPSPHTGHRARSMPVSRCISCGGRFRCGFVEWSLAEEAPASRQRLSTRAIGEQPEVADRMKPRGTTCSRKRRRNSSVCSVRIFTRSRSA